MLAALSLLVFGSFGSMSQPVLVDGCEQFIKPNVCVMHPDKTLKLWTKTLTALAEPQLAKTAQIKGSGYLVALSANRVKSPIVFEGNTTIKKLHVKISPVENWRRAYELAKNSSDEKAAEELLIKYLAQKPKDAEAIARLARIKLRHGETKEAKALLHRGLQLHEKNGNLSGFINNSTLLVYLALLREKNYQASAALIDKLAKVKFANAIDMYYVHYYRGIFYREVGRYLDAKEQLTQAEYLATQFDYGREAAMAMQAKAELQLMTGQYQAALAIYEELLASELFSQCEQMQLFISTAWSMLLQAEYLKRFQDDERLTETFLNKALKINQESCPTWLATKKNIHLNKAYYYVLMNELESAETELTRAAQLEVDDTFMMQSWSLDLQARVALAGGDIEKAMLVYKTLYDLSEEKAIEESQWRATIGLALVFIQLKQESKAISLLEENDQRFYRASQQVAITDGRSSFYTQRARNTELLIASYLANQQPKKALTLIRRNRARILLDTHLSVEKSRQEHKLSQQSKRYTSMRRLHEEAAADAWMLAENEYQRQRLAEEKQTETQVSRVAKLFSEESLYDFSISDGNERELKLFLHQADEKMFVFGQLAGHVDYRVFKLDPSKSLKLDDLKPMLAWLDSMLESAQQVGFYVTGELNNLALHHLEIGGKRLIERVPVLYRLDIPDTQQNWLLPEHRVMLVGDARSDLPHSRREINTIAAHLNAQNTLKLSGDAVDYNSFRHELIDATHLHYSGHGFFKISAWESSLALADDRHFNVIDILTLPRVPNSVVLSACETAQQMTHVNSADWNIANAFLLAGASWVLGASRAVDDKQSLLFMEQLYKNWQQFKDIRKAYRSTQLAMDELGDESTWQHFRLYVR